MRMILADSKCYAENSRSRGGRYLWIGWLRQFQYYHEGASDAKKGEEHFRERTQLMQRPPPVWLGHSEEKLGWYDGKEAGRGLYELSWEKLEGETNLRGKNEFCFGLVILMIPLDVQIKISSKS